MGAYLSSPVTDKETEQASNVYLEYGIAAMQGWRVTMEDAHAAILGLDNREDAGFFAIFDGHGGCQVARFCAKYMPQELLKSPAYRYNDIKGALKEAYLEMDNRLRLREYAEVLNMFKTKTKNSQAIGANDLVEDQDGLRSDASYEGPTAGCTAVVAVVQGRKLYVANAGDSRCVLCRGMQTVPLTDDHKPTDPDEERRIQAAGGYVTEGRVNGCLNLSRAIGDLNYKQLRTRPAEEQIVTAMPDVRVVELVPTDRFLILACDGIWDILSNEDAVQFVSERLEVGLEPVKICEEMCDHCLATNTEGVGKGCDNMSAMVVVLKTW